MQAREWGGGGGGGHSRQGTSLSEGEELGRGTDCAGSGVRLGGSWRSGFWVQF